MTIGIITLIGALLALIPVIIKVLQNRKAKREALARTEADELLAGMDAVDALDDIDKRMQPPPQS